MTKNSTLQGWSVARQPCRMATLRLMIQNLQASDFVSARPRLWMSWKESSLKGFLADLPNCRNWSKKVDWDVPISYQSQRYLDPHQKHSKTKNSMGPTIWGSSWIAANSIWPWPKLMDRFGLVPQQLAQWRCLQNSSAWVQGALWNSPKQRTLCQIPLLKAVGCLSQSMMPPTWLCWKKPDRSQNIFKTSPSGTRHVFQQLVFNMFLNTVFKCWFNECSSTKYSWNKKPLKILLNWPKPLYCKLLFRWWSWTTFSDRWRTVVR